MADSFDGKVLLPAWHQKDPYNLYCPYNFTEKKRSVTGCVATAAAQTVWYWLKRGYTDDITITLTQDDAYTYYSTDGDICYTIDASKENAEKFKYLPFEKVNKILADENISSKEYIAALNFATGVYHWMDYDHFGGLSGSMPSENFFPWLGMNYANGDMFGHSIDYEYVGGKDVWTITEGFYEVLIDNLLAGCPVIVVNEDHAFVIDGYNSKKDTFHVNWGNGDGGTWRSRSSLHSLGPQGFLYDIMPVNYREFDFTVTDNDYYGIGTLKRAFELANIHSGHDTLTFDLSAEHKNFIPGGSSGDYTSAFFQTYESLTIDSMDMIIDLNSIIFHACNTGMRDEEVLSLEIRDFSGIINHRNNINFYNCVMADKLDLSFNKGALAAGNRLTVDDILSFKEEGISALDGVLSGFVSSCNGNCTAGEYGNVIASGDHADTISLTDHSLIVGSIDLGEGQNSLSVRNNSLITYAYGINLGSERSTLTVDSTSQIAAHYIEGDIDLTYILEEISDNAMIAVHSTMLSELNSITIDAVNAQNGTYILCNCYTYGWEDVEFTIVDKSKTYTLKLGESAGGFSLSAAKEYDEYGWLTWVYGITLTVSGYVHDQTAPVKPGNWNLSAAVQENVNSAMLNWNAASDESAVEGYFVRYGQNSGNLTGEVFFTGNSGTLTGLSDGTYFFQVCAVDRSGNRSSWSEEKSFEVVLTDTEAPESTSPECIVSENLLTHYFDLDFKDADIEEPCTYRVKFGSTEKAALASNLIYEADQWGNIFSYRDVGKTFYYSIQAVDSAGNVSEWSKTAVLELKDTSTPTNTTVTGTQKSKEDNCFTVNWNEVSDFSFVTYEFEFSANSDFSDAFRYSVENAEEKTFYLPVGEFYWRYRTVDGAGNVSAWKVAETPVANSYFKTIDDLERNELWSGGYQVTADADLVFEKGDSWNDVETISVEKDNLSITLKGDNDLSVSSVSVAEYPERVSTLTFNLEGEDISLGYVSGNNLIINIDRSAADFAFSRLYGSQSVTVNGDISGIIHCGISSEDITVNGDISGFVGGQITSSCGVDISVSGVIIGDNSDEYSDEQIKKFLKNRFDYKDMFAQWQYDIGAVIDTDDEYDSHISLVDQSVAIGNILASGDLELTGKSCVYGRIYGETLDITVDDSAEIVGDVEVYNLNFTISGDASFTGTFKKYNHSYTLQLTDNNLTACAMDVQYTNWDDQRSFTVDVDALSKNGTYQLVQGSYISSWKNLSLDIDDRRYDLQVGKKIEINGVKYSLSRSGNMLKLAVSGLVRRDIKAEATEAVAAEEIVVSNENSSGSIKLQLSSCDKVMFYNYSTMICQADGETSGREFTADLSDQRSKLVGAVDDGTADVFFARSYSTWNGDFSAIYQNENKDMKIGKVSLSGKNRITDIFVGSDNDANILFLTDDSNGDALFVDDVFSDSYKEPGVDPWAMEKSRLQNLDEIRAGAGDDVIDFTSKNFDVSGCDGLIVRGGSGDDVIWSADFAGNLFGDEGDDVLVGGSVNDHISGGSGDDYLHGGGGDDTFYFGGNWGDDVIEQLSDGTVNLVIAGGSADYWDGENYDDGINSIRIKSDCQINISYVDKEMLNDENGFFAEFSTGKIFEDDEDLPGVIAIL